METPKVQGLEKNRIEALIDGIFSVALTLLVLDIKLPENIAYPTNDALWARLLTLERHFAIYAISFIVIGIYWVAHHVQFHYVRCTDRPLIWINMLFLLVISFVPFASDLVDDNEGLTLPCVIYGVTLLGLSVLSYVHLRYLTRHPHLATDDFTPRTAELITHRIVMFSLVPMLSLLISLWNTRLALYVYFVLAFLHLLPGRLDRHLHGENEIGSGSDIGPT